MSAKHNFDTISSRILISIGQKPNQSHHEIISSFISDPHLKILFACVQNSELVVTTSLPKDDGNVKRIFYMFKNTEAITDIVKHTVFGVLKTPFISAISQIVEKLYSPLFFDPEFWPDSVRHDLNSQIHRFLSTITEHKFKLQSKTVIYIPNENLKLPVELSSRDKEFVSRLENVVIHWTRQIKDVLHEQDSSASLAENTQSSLGVLDEVSFWKNRCNDLLDLSKQLELDEVIKITEILYAAKSSYVRPFKKLAVQIVLGSKQAQSNLMFLNLLVKPCEELLKTKPKNIPEQEYGKIFSNSTLKLTYSLRNLPNSALRTHLFLPYFIELNTRTFTHSQNYTLTFPIPVPELLDNLLMIIRVIWVDSEFYNTREKLTGLFKKLSNGIIKICKNDIDLSKIKTGFIKSSEQCLNECISCLTIYKQKYKFNQRVHHKLSDIPWVLDQGKIFAEVDAFIQRAKDLLEVCECQKHFARWIDGNQEKTPVFHGKVGTNISRSLKEIENELGVLINSLFENTGDVLDVKKTTWHTRFRKFKQRIKDLEVMIVSCMTAAFDSHRTIENCLLVIEIFQHFSCRESVKRELDKKTKELWYLFMEEVNNVKQLLATKKPILIKTQPKFAGSAKWARLLKSRIQRPMNLLEKAALFLPKTGTGEEAVKSFNNLIDALDDYIRNQYNSWTMQISKECISKLDQPLMTRSKIYPELLDVNFDTDILKLFEEISHWERLMYEIPHYASEVYSKKDELRMLREMVKLVVRDYNNIISLLTPSERLLFKERIRVLDKKIIPGLGKLTWATKGISDFFIQDCRNHSATVMRTVKEFKANQNVIAKKCVKISSLLLVNLDKKTVYSGLKFSESQNKHRAIVKKQLMVVYKEIVDLMKNSASIFIKDGVEVYKSWVSYVDQIDQYLQEAIRVNAKQSLSELSIAINGDGKQVPVPLFKVDVILEGSGRGRYGYEPPRVKFLPDLDELGEDVIKLSENLGDAFDGLHRLVNLPSLMRKNVNFKPPFSDIMKIDGEMGKQLKLIRSGLAENASKLFEDLEMKDEKYMEIYVPEKETWIKRYEIGKPEVSTFTSDINRFTEQINNIQMQIETVVVIDFVMLDCGGYKNSLISHCEEWKIKFLELLQKMFVTEFEDLERYLKENSDKVVQPPESLEDLGESVDLYDNLMSEKEKTESLIEPIISKYRCLMDYEVVMENTIDPRCLEGLWKHFLEALNNGDLVLKKSKEKFKSGLLASTDEFKRNTANLSYGFNESGPFADTSTEEEKTDPQTIIQETKEKVAVLRKQQENLRKGLAIFKIDAGHNKDLDEMDRDLEYLQKVWDYDSLWKKLTKEWFRGSFRELVTTDMEVQAFDLFKQVARLQREVKEKEWPIIATVKSKINQFKRTMPLIVDLKNKAIECKQKIYKNYCEKNKCT